MSPTTDHQQQTSHARPHSTTLDHATILGLIQSTFNSTADVPSPAWPPKCSRASAGLQVPSPPPTAAVMDLVTPHPKRPRIGRDDAASYSGSRSSGGSTRAIGIVDDETPRG
ncbi:hypothetical protein NUW58_g3712 [Xylaria curta]|uniref:Uncharacterized protein n=1 Tax=Xylaria curta TaxID=42375 RepID=A0ACC1P9N7_9PEZI|nr:hypothetical protein NUW58_g3712 [Xylaria curta]